jgi:hypothetical protein
MASHAWFGPNLPNPRQLTKPINQVLAEIGELGLGHFKGNGKQQQAVKDYDKKVGQL